MFRRAGGVIGAGLGLVRGLSLVGFLALWLWLPPCLSSDAVTATGTRTGSDFVIGFGTASNWVYQVDYADTLPQWQVLKSGIAGTGSPTNKVDALSVATRSQRYYRVSAKPWEPDTNRFAWIAPGTFVMGSPSREKDRYPDEGPQTTVTLTRGYWMGRYEVTQAEYQAVLGGNPSHFTGDLTQPVEQVSWLDATNYCDKRTQQDRQAGLIPAGYEYRLPTEAEWEYACRAGTTTRFYWGDDLSYTGIGSYAWYTGNTGWNTYPVGQKPPNAWGLYDMSGNVWEWCSDRCLNWYGKYPGGSVTDPKGAGAGSYRVLRGGCWNSYAAYCRSALRNYATPAVQSIDIGFRVVLAPVSP